MKLGLIGNILVSAVLLSACSGTSPTSLSDSPNSSEIAASGSTSQDKTMMISEASSTSPVSSESEFESFLEAWGSEAASEMAEGFGVDIAQVPELIGNQARRIELNEALQKEFPSELTAVWTTDKLQKEIHVSAKSQQVLDHAKSLEPDVRIHLVKYSYSDMEVVNANLVNLLYHKLGALGDRKSFVGLDPINTTIHLGIDGLSDQQKSQPEFTRIRDLIREYSDLIKLSNDYETWGPGEAEEA